jgi:hypothetical protein
MSLRSEVEEAGTAALEIDGQGGRGEVSWENLEDDEPRLM